MALPGILQQLDNLDKSSPQFSDQLTSLLYEEGYKRCIPGLPDKDVVWLVEYLDNTVGTLDSSGPAFRKCLRELGRICGTRGELPQSYTLEGSLSSLSKHPVASGGSGDVYKGLLDGSTVCVKRLRIYAKDHSPVARKAFCREAVMWKHLTHPNIVPLLGVTLAPLQLVSAWMPGGDLKEYITKHPGIDQLNLLSGIADGLDYLHSRNMVHGDLKGPNILVDGSGCPRIIDFGLAIVVQNQDSIRSAQGEHGHTARWTAPEILNEQGAHSKEADVFSFAMVMIEAFTGNVPFHPQPPTAAMLAILGGDRPPRPTHPNLTDELWALMQSCWNQDAHSRPEMSTVLQILRGSDPPSNRPFSNSQPPGPASSRLPGPTNLQTPNPVSSRTPDSASSQMPDPETDEYIEHPKLSPSSKPQGTSSGTETSSPTSRGESTGQDNSGSTQPSGGSQAAKHNPMRYGNGPLPDDKQEGHISPSQSEPATPLPIDPAQIYSQLRGPIHGWTSEPHTDLPTTLGNNHASRKDIGGPRMGKGQENVRFGLYDDSKGDTGEMYRSGSQEDPIPTPPNPTHTEGYRGSESRNHSHTHLLGNPSTNNLGNPSQSQLNLRDSGRNPSRPIPGPTSGGTPSRNSSRKRPHVANPRSGSRDERPPGQSGRVEPPNPQPHGTSSPREPPKGEVNPWVHTGHEYSKGEEGSQKTSDCLAVSSNPPKNHGIWCRLKRKLGCVSDKNMQL